MGSLISAPKAAFVEVKGEYQRVLIGYTWSGGEGYDGGMIDNRDGALSTPRPAPEPAPLGLCGK